MAISFKHAFTNPKSDGSDDTVVRPSNWNAEHVLTLDSARVIGRATAGNGAAEELDGAAVRTIADVSQAGVVGVNTQTGAAYTLVAGDRNKVVERDNAGSNTITIPTNASVAFPIGTQIAIVQTGNGQTTINASGGVTLSAFDSAFKIRGRFAGACVYKRGTDEWIAFGSLTT
jgi:hypothetical protein